LQDELTAPAVQIARRADEDARRVTLHRIIRIGMTRHDKFRPDNLSHILAR
jgi:hypothetical protein